MGTSRSSPSSSLWWSIGQCRDATRNTQRQALEGVIIHMKTQHTDTAGTSAVPPTPARSKRKGWLAGVGAIIVVVLVVGLSALVFAQLRQHQANQSTMSTPPSGQWKQVLQGYAITSIVAARSNPSVLYACAMQAPVTSQ